MIIQLNHASSTSPHKTNPLPSALVKLTGGVEEVLLIELQGSLATVGNTSGQLVGVLTIDENNVSVWNFYLSICLLHGSSVRSFPCFSVLCPFSSFWLPFGHLYSTFHRLRRPSLRSLNNRAARFNNDRSEPSDQPRPRYDSRLESVLWTFSCESSPMMMMMNMNIDWHPILLMSYFYLPLSWLGFGGWFAWLWLCEPQNPNHSNTTYFFSFSFVLGFGSAHSSSRTHMGWIL